MSDISEQNAERMIVESKRMHKAVADLTGMITAMNAKITTLSNEVAALKQKQVLAAVQSQMDAKGHGGTA